VTTAALAGWPAVRELVPSRACAGGAGGALASRAVSHPSVATMSGALGSSAAACYGVRADAGRRALGRAGFDG
jgi:hypothetical protein